VLVLAFAARMRPAEALGSAIKVAAGFAGVFVALGFFVSRVSPALKAFEAASGMDFPVVDVGWPPLAAITWTWSLAPVTIILVAALNIAMLALRLTNLVYIDIWNYWNFAFVGALLSSVGARPLTSLAGALAAAVYTIKTAEWSAPYVKRECGLEGIAISPLTVTGFLPWAVAVNRVIDAIPLLRDIGVDRARPASPDGNRGPRLRDLLREPMTIGLAVGLLLALLARYDLKASLELGVEVAAVMFILPRCGALIGEGMGAVSAAFRAVVLRRFPRRHDLSFAMDTGILLTNPSVIATGLVLMPISLGLAFLLPGARLIPLADLPNLISIFSVTTLVVGGNVFRAVIAALPLVASFILIAGRLAPLVTALAAKAGLDFGASGSPFTSFTDGGNPLRFWIFRLFQGDLVALSILPLVAILLVLAWRDHRRVRAENISPS
jgi:PTS system galactitol-specific IIC component